MKVTMYFFFFICIFSCNKQEEPKIPELKYSINGVVIEQPYLWKTPLAEDSYLGTFVKPSLIWDNKILLGAETNNSSDLVLMDIDTGEKIWQKEYSDKDLISINVGYQYGNLAIIDGLGSKFSGLNITSGDLIWDFSYDGWFWTYAVSGISDKFFLCGQTNTINKPYELWSAWYGDVNTGETNEFLVPDIVEMADTSSLVKESGVAGGIERIIPYQNHVGEVLLIIQCRTKFESTVGESFFALYNFTKKEYIYQNVKLNSIVKGFPEIIDEKIYFALRDGIYCYDVSSGNIIWEKPLNDPTSWGGFIFEDKLFAIEDELTTADSYLFCIDINSGKMLWRVPSKQCSASIRYLNGVVYFASSEDHKLHAYDAETGKQLWHIESPDFKYDEGAFFKPECSVVPGKNGEKGKVIVSSYFNAFCYEAIR